MANLDHLNVLATICDTGRFQLASKKLNKARSAVSNSVKQVEDFHQVQVFDRSTRRPTLTRDAKRCWLRSDACLPRLRNSKTLCGA